jgi:hypothetical protein
MNMQNPRQDDFAELRRLLALKRHEIPPPGYFNGFSREVILRIQAGETGSNSWFGRFSSATPWLQGLYSLFNAKPLAAGAFGVTVCGVLAVGLFSSETPSNIQPAPLGGPPLAALAGTLVSTDGVATVHSATFNSGSIFQDQRQPQSQFLKFNVPGAN